MRPEERAIAAVIDELARDFEHCGCFSPRGLPRPARGDVVVFYAADGARHRYGDVPVNGDVLAGWRNVDRLAARVARLIADQLEGGRAGARSRPPQAPAAPSAPSRSRAAPS